MKISICPILYSNTHLLVEASEDSDFTFLSRRISRTATLDGECVIVDNGFTASDGTIKVIVNPNQNSLEIYQAATAIIQSFGLLTVSNRDGCFLAAIESVSNKKTELIINFLIKKQLN